MNSIARTIKTASKQIGRFVDKHSSEILLGCGIVGFISTVILVSNEAPVVKEKLEELHEDLATRDEEVTKSQIIFEEVKTALPVYAPAIVSGAVSIGCVLGSYKVATNRTAAWATAYELTQASFVEYKNKVKDEIGEKAEREIVHKLNEENIAADPPPKSMEETKNEVIMLDGKSLFKLKFNGRYFRSTIDEIRHAEKIISDRLNTEMYVNFNEFQYELGLSATDDGDVNGFNVEDGIDIIFDPCMAPNGDSCTIVDFLVKPTPDKYQ